MFQLLTSFGKFGAFFVLYGLFFGMLIIFPTESSAQVLAPMLSIRGQHLRARMSAQKKH
jgi:hypothetical protein